MKISKEVQNQNRERIMKIKAAFKNARTMKEKKELTERLFGKTTSPA